MSSEPRYCFIFMLLLLTLWNGANGAVPLTLERGNGPEPDSLDPARAQGLSAHQVLRDLFEGLVIEVAEGRLVGGVATRWQASADGLRWTFELRRDARFADGRAVEAADFAWSLKRALDPATGAPYAALLLPLRGAAARLAGKPVELGVHAPDPHTLVIELERPTLDLPARLSLPIAMPLDRHQVGADGTRFVRAGRLNGNGAYRLVEWQPGAWLTLERNPHFHARATVAIPRVRFHVTEDAAQEARRFAAGELHLTETVPPQPLAGLRARWGAALRIGPAHGTFFLGYNLRRPPFAGQPGLREALSLVLDRELLVRVVTGTGEVPAHGLLPPALRHGPPLPARDRAADLARARQLYAEAGYSAERPLQLELRFNTSSLNRRLMLALAAMWQEQLGVVTRLRNEEWKVFVRNRRAGVLTQVFRGGWNADIGEPLNFLEPFAADSNLNYTGFRSTAFEAALQRALGATDPAVRTAATAAAERELLAAQAIVPLFHYTTKHLVDPRLQGFEAHPLDHHPSRWLHFADPAPVR